MDVTTYLKDLEYLVNIDSGSDDPEGLNTVAAFFSRGFRDMGWIVREYDLAPQSGTCLVCANREAEHYDVMLMGHMDTVFPKGTCAQRSFRIEGNRAYGPGVCDMKHGCLMMYYLLKELPQQISDKLNVLAVFNPDEEIGSIHSQSVYAPYAKKTDYAFLFEARGAQGTSCHQRKGSIGFDAVFTGVAGHCGFVFENGARSAISEMARWITTLDGLQSRELDTSVNVGVVKGGIKTNVVPEHASMSVSIRFSRLEEVQRIEDTLQRLLQQAEVNGIKAELQNRRGKMPLVPDEKASAYIAHITELTAKHALPLIFKARGGLSDANIVAQYGPICLDGLGPAGGSGHSPDEYMLLDTIEPSFQIANLLLQDLANNK